MSDMSEIDDGSVSASFSTPMKVRYAVGNQDREALVITGGMSLADHVERLESGGSAWVSFILARGGRISLRLDSVVALELSR
ncbi:hypothetical protein [Streptomyces sp. NPDC052042]|uniref:hypothetical protein n=1 Tax=Streptomyces sp. NPDC052042 TaxID=3365683 RepID=UPI0037D762A8